MELRAGVITGAINVAVILRDVGRLNLLDALALWSEQLVVVLPENHPLASVDIRVAEGDSEVPSPLWHCRELLNQAHSGDGGF